MNVSALGYSAQVVTSGARQVHSQLGKNDFLQLLVAQMRYQDPMKPMENKEFVAQLAQFSALEQMMNVGLSSNLTYGMSVLNKMVYATDAGGLKVQGTAVSVRVVDNKPMVKVRVEQGDPVEVDLSRVYQVDSE